MAKGNPNPKPGPGRKPGVPNKSTTYVRDMVKLFLEDNVDQIHKWLSDVAAKDPAEALKILQGFMEYHLPKLQRTDTTITGEIKMEKVEFIRPQKTIDHDGV